MPSPISTPRTITPRVLTSARQNSIRLVRQIARSSATLISRSAMKASTPASTESGMSRA